MKITLTFDPSLYVVVPRVDLEALPETAHSLIAQEVRRLLAAAPLLPEQPQGEICVTRQNADGEILSITWEAAPPAGAVTAPAQGDGTDATYRGHPAHGFSRWCSICNPPMQNDQASSGPAGAPAVKPTDVASAELRKARDLCERWLKSLTEPTSTYCLTESELVWALRELLNERKP